MNKFSLTLFFSILIIISGISISYAGTLTPPGTPSKTMKSLSDLRELVNIGSNTPSVDFTTPGTVSATMFSLGDTYDLLVTKIAAIDTTKILTGTTIFGKAGTATAGANYTYGDNTASKVLTTATGSAGTYDASNLSVGTVKSGITFGVSLTGEYPSATYPLTGDTGATDATAGGVLNGLEAWTKAGVLMTGTIVTQTLSALSETLSAGYYNATTLSTVDTDLIAGNILSGKTIFGVAGSIVPSPTYGDNDATKVLNTASNPGTFDPNTVSTYSTLNLSVGTVKSGITFGNSGALTGDYPSVTYPLTGDTGATDAVAGDILNGLEVWTKAGALVTGTMPTQTLSVLNDTVSAGYYSATTLSAVDTDLATGNIKSGSTIFGIAGDANVVNTSTGDAVAGDMLNGKVAWVDGASVTGTIATQTLSVLNDTVSAGYYSATTLSAVDTDLATGNIKSGSTIFGIAGNSNVVDTSTGTAVASQILSTLVAWVDGVSITGTMANVGAQTITPTTSNTTITTGYHNGSGYCAGDGDLTASNIKSGTNIFGVAGSALVYTSTAQCDETFGTTNSCSGSRIPDRSFDGGGGQVACREICGYIAGATCYTVSGNTCGCWTGTPTVGGATASAACTN